MSGSAGRSFKGPPGAGALCYVPPRMHTALLALLIQILLLIAPAHAADAIIRVHASVADAEVFVDGKSLGRVPVTSMVSPGSHSLRVVADGFDPYVRRVEATEGKALDVTAALVPGNGTVEFTGPPGARLSMDNADRGPLPIRLAAPSPGTHSWKVEAPKFEPETGTFDFRLGQNLLFDVKLTPSEGVFVVTTTPPGAEVYLDGESVGVTPLRLTGVEPDLHGVDVRLAGHARLLRSVDTRDGARGEVTATLPSKGAEIGVTTGDDAAKVYVNDVLVGTGSSVKTGLLEAGRVTVRVETGAAPVTSSQTLEAGDNLLLKLSGTELVERPPLTQRWGFWAAVGGGAVAVAGGAAVVAVAAEPPPLPTGDTVETLP